MKKMKKDIIICYDSKDYDGLGSMAIVNKYYAEENIIPIGLDRDMNTKQKGFYIDRIVEELTLNTFEIMFLDLAPRTIQQMHSVIESIPSELKVTIIDHHKLLYNPSEYQNVDYVFKMGVSACMLTWNNFYSGFLSPPPAVELINDRDIWANKLQPQTNYFTNTFGMIDLDMLEYLIFEDDGSQLQNILEVGEFKEGFKKIRITSIVESNIVVMGIKGRKVAVPTVDLGKEQVSEVGNLACEKYDVDFFMSQYRKSEGFGYELRSLDGQGLKFIRENGFKGGGHPNACGFSSKLDLIIKDEDIF